MTEDTYPADIPCPMGHMSPRYKETNMCVECAAFAKAYRKKSYRLTRHERKILAKEGGKL